MRNVWIIVTTVMVAFMLSACNTGETPSTEPDIETADFGTVSCHTPQSGYGNCLGLSRGDKGLWVKLLQEWLNRRGFNAGRVDHDFGPKTEAAVRRAQKAYGLSVDGFAGTCTWTALFHNSGRRARQLYIGC